jgi:hypothetical protein
MIHSQDWPTEQQHIKVNVKTFQHTTHLLSSVIDEVQQQLQAFLLLLLYCLHQIVQRNLSLIKPIQLLKKIGNNKSRHNTS